MFFRLIVYVLNLFDYIFVCLFVVLSLVPSLPPDNFGVHNVTNDTIIITWTDIPPLSIHGELQTYHVSGCGLLRNDTWHCFSKHVTNYYAKFTLFPGTMYRFTLSGCTNVGCGAETYLEQSLLEMGKK